MQTTVDVACVQTPPPPLLSKIRARAPISTEGRGGGVCTQATFDRSRLSFEEGMGEMIDKQQKLNRLSQSKPPTQFRVKNK